VIDLNPNSLLKELEDLSQVEKYTISEEDYDKLPGNAELL
jgi:tubulin-specific chaperone B